jgi:hypothetical protein
MTPEQARAAARARVFVERDAAQPSTTEDVVRSGGRGLMQGIVDNFAPVGPGVQSGDGPVAVPDWMDQMRPGGPTNPTPEPGSGARFLARAAGTSAGGYAQSIMNFLGGDLPFMGGGGVARTLLGDVAGGALSENLGQRLESNGNDGTWGRVLGGIVGTGAVAGLPNPRRGTYRAGKLAATMGELPGTPQGGQPFHGRVSEQDLQTATNAFYDHLRQMGVTYRAPAWEKALNNIRSGLERRHWREGALSPTGPVFERLDQEIREAASGAPDFAKLEGLSQTLGEYARDAQNGKSPNLALGEAYRYFRNRVDAFITNAQYTSGHTPLPAGQVSQLYRTGRALALRNIKARRLDQMVKSGGHLRRRLRRRPPRADQRGTALK